MNMRPQKVKKENAKKPNLYKAILIKTALLNQGKTQAMIAKDLGITDAAVSRALRDLSPSRNVNRWIEKNLGIAV